MPLQYHPDRLLERAEMAAYRSFGGQLGPLKPREAMYAACVAAFRERQAQQHLVLTLAEQEARLTAVATRAIAEAMAGRMERLLLKGGIEHLPQPQQLVLSLRFGENMNDAEIAAVLGCTPEAVMVLTTLALVALQPKP